MERQSQEYVPEEDERSRREIYMDIPENVEITRKHVWIGRVISDKQIKINAIHSVMQQA